MGLFEKLAGSLSKLTRLLPCPQCRATQAVAAESSVVTCASCGYRASRTEWSFRRFHARNAPEQPRADPDLPPAGTKIVRRELEGGAIAWEIPPSGKAGGLLGFSILWLGFIALWTSFALYGAIGSEEPAPFWFPLFSLPFWLVGVAMLYFGLRAKLARHLLIFDSAEVLMVRSFLKRRKRRALARGDVQSVEKKAFYEQNYQPVFGVEIRGGKGKLRFGTTLGEEEKDWLVADMQRVLWPRREEPADADGTLSIPSAGPRDSFEVVFPPPPGGEATGLVVGLLMAGGFLAIGLFALQEAGLFRWLWLGFNGLFAAAMVAGTVFFLKSRGRAIHVHGDRSEIKVLMRRDRQTLRETHLPRRGRIEVHAYRSGASNGTNRLRIELVAEDRVVPIASWYPEETAREPLAALRSALGQPPAPPTTSLPR